MAKIFICYRREDSAYPAHQIYRDLSDHFGSESVIFDVDTIPIGTDFREYLNNQVGECDILLAIIGDQWIEILKQRLSDPKDFVRIEIQAALERDIPVVPVLVGKALMPSEENLPPELAGLSYRNATEVRAGTDLQTHVKRLIEGLDRLLAGSNVRDYRKRQEAQSKPREKSKARRQKRIALGIGAVSMIIILCVIGWLIYSKPPFANTFTNSIGMNFVKIPAGSFTMGSKLSPEELAQKYGGKVENYKTERPQHEAPIIKAFYLQSTEVTQGQWKAVMGYNPSHFKDCGADCPVEQVSWDDAQKFIQKLNDTEGAEAYRLPTEAEWEYAVSAATTTEFSHGDDENKLGEYAWFDTNSEDKTHPVGTKKANPWGLYDMQGNVWEWVEDDWHGNYKGAPYDGSVWVYDPRGPNRVIRGGSWGNKALYCRSAARYGEPRSSLGKDIGFRLARFVDLGS